MILNELRSNPDKNPKTSGMELLLKYRGDPDVFVTFTQGFGKKSYPKLGINPKSSFETPLGIYTYPIDYIIEYSRKSGKITGPFTGTDMWENLIIVRNTSHNVIENDDDVITYAYRERLERLVKHSVDDPVEFIQNSDDDALVQTPMGMFWNLSRNYAQYIAEKSGKQPSVMWNVLMRHLGIDGVINRMGEGIIHSSEETQAVFFNKTLLRIIDIVRRESAASPDIGYLIRDIRNNKFDYNKFRPDWINYLIHHSDYVDVIEKVMRNSNAVKRHMMLEPTNFSNATIPEMMALYCMDGLDPLRKTFPLIVRKLINMRKLDKLSELLKRELTEDDWMKIINVSPLKIVNVIFAGDVTDLIIKALVSVVSSMNHTMEYEKRYIVYRITEYLKNNNTTYRDEILEDLWKISPDVVGYFSNFKPKTS